MKKTMKRHSFTSQLKSLALVFGVALAFVSCANEDVAQNPTNPNDDNDKNLTTFVAGDEAKTRTSLDYNSGDFYWEAGDYIYVKDDNNVLQKSSNAPTSKVASFKYKVPGKFTASTSYKVYYLGKYSSGNQVTISFMQSQAVPNDTEHFGTAGDYGTATATKVTGKQQFAFELEHQPAYLVFQPYTSNPILHNCYLTKVEVFSDNDIAETYTINPSTDNLDGSSIGPVFSKRITLFTGGSGSSSNPNGFSLTNTSPSVAINGAYMVIKPGTHTLRVRYWVKDLVSNVEGTITKLLPSTAYASNTYYNMTANLDVKDYDSEHYYMWDAQYQYWQGHSGSQPKLNGQSSGDYPQSGTISYYNTTYPGYGISNPATQSCATLPNVNEICWYAKDGDPRADDFELWSTMGHLHRGGMWFKKKAYISTYRDDLAPDGNDWRIHANYMSWTASSILPDAADLNKYFFLPYLGRYTSGKLEDIDTRGYYWSSSASPSSNSDQAYYLSFFGGGGYVESLNLRSNGYRVMKFE